MYKIMLADDEGIVIDSLKFIIEKEFPGECEIVFARTGRSVIELAESFRPDIAVMDIQMPGINGIDAMREIRRTNTSVVFLVMSAYDKFDYAQEAIKLGVQDYITKPMDRHKMVSALERAMQVVDAERAKRSNDLLIREKLETVVPILESGLIYNILFHEHFSEDIDNYRELLDIHESSAYMMTIVCGESQDGNHMTNAVGSSVRISKHYQEIREFIKEYFPNCIIGTVMANKIAVLVPFFGDRMEYNDRSELIDRARELVRRMRSRLDISFRIGIGKVKAMADMSDSYSEAINALVMTTGSVAHADDLPMGCDYTDDYPIHIEKKLFEAISVGKRDEAMAQADDYCEWMKKRNIMDVRLKCLEFVLWAEHLAFENGGMTYRFEDRHDYLPAVMRMEDMTELMGWFKSKIGEACDNICDKRSERSASVVEKAKEYIDRNYEHNISLEETSKSVNISPYYFSRVFKEETGVNFIEYVTDVRINKAKELLDTTDSSVKEICTMVGYSDPNYFSRAFKKNVGVTPTEYKEGQR